RLDDQIAMLSRDPESYRFHAAFQKPYDEGSMSKARLARPIGKTRSALPHGAMRNIQFCIGL
ncbi:MAG TPA: hypothetical protein VLZ81_01660, partial [Blastocatellia bacterium]|nr:hypothetical protein [Blastocatellia bacterium]